MYFISSVILTFRFLLQKSFFYTGLLYPVPLTSNPYTLYPDYHTGAHTRSRHPYIVLCFPLITLTIIVSGLSYPQDSFLIIFIYSLWSWFLYIEIILSQINGFIMIYCQASGQLILLYKDFIAPGYFRVQGILALRII